jgi:cytochrome c-type biogenesis protein CcmE
MNKSYLIGGLLIVAFLSIGAVGFMKSLTPYVSISEARAATSTVQVKGALDKSRITVDKLGDLNFYITDENSQEMKVVYRGSKPGNFTQATHVVAIGAYRDNAFRADKLIVKCPSKYQGQTSGSQ